MGMGRNSVIRGPRDMSESHPHITCHPGKFVKRLTATRSGSEINAWPAIKCE